MKSIAICVTGWHFTKEFYDRLAALSDVTVFVVSHKPPDKTPAYLTELVSPDHILYKANIGYDWGCYQQFLETNLWQQFDYIFFMHDDVVIKSDDFVSATVGLLNSGAKFVGNGRNSTKRDWPATHLACYSHSKWHPPSKAFEHETVRGSFFATNRETLETLGDLEVFWDPFHINIRFGNWSLISSSGKMQALFGEGCFAFLGEFYQTSDYLIELERGDAVTPSEPSKVKQKLTNWIVRLGTYYTENRLQDDLPIRKQMTMRLGEIIISILAGIHPNNVDL